MPPEPRRYADKSGYLKIVAKTPGEAPIWCPVRIISATLGYQQIFMLVEPLGGFGTMRVSSKRVWMEDQTLNQCKVKLT